MTFGVIQLLRQIEDYDERGFATAATSAVAEYDAGDMSDDEIIAYLNDLLAELKDLAAERYKNRWQDQGFLCDYHYHDSPYG